MFEAHPRDGNRQLWPMSAGLSGKAHGVERAPVALRRPGLLVGGTTWPEDPYAGRSGSDRRDRGGDLRATFPVVRASRTVRTSRAIQTSRTARTSRMTTYAYITSGRKIRSP